MLRALADDLWVDIDDIQVVYFGKEKNQKNQVKVNMYFKDNENKHIDYLIEPNGVARLKEYMEERIRREEAEYERKLRGHRDNGAGP